MKYKFHIPVEQYGFIEVEHEFKSSSEAVDAYKTLSDYAKKKAMNSTPSPKVEEQSS